MFIEPSNFWQYWSVSHFMNKKDDLKYVLNSALYYRLVKMSCLILNGNGTALTPDQLLDKLLQGQNINLAGKYVLKYLFSIVFEVIMILNKLFLWLIWISWTKVYLFIYFFNVFLVCPIFLPVFFFLFNVELTRIGYNNRS